ncbi:MFS transporter [Corynebacterium epidermidicanis]|uniref:Arabinose efflux permease family protein n=1 Tax=Corynebacterium epidermidicanis TaxID=1050174 RepID=A0A0G3GSX1_9CORY|nr:MFS transporter [Corynebacterium epidermidicanis]AKK04224.1 arabinose efflux permease family protein [Corynebacterium epidermidicanis]
MSVKPANSDRAWLPIALGMFIIAAGANAYAPMLQVYRISSQLSEHIVTFLLGAYVLGLIPALLIAGPLSDQLGRRRFMRIAFVASLAASALLGAAALIDVPARIALLTLGRFVCGISVGCVMASGAAWLKEVSTGPAAVAARRATVATSAGFGLGPLFSGAIAQWLPWNMLLPWAVHFVCAAVIAVLAWHTPEAAREAKERSSFRLPPAAFTPRFLWSVAAWAPWAFGCATTSFATLAGLTADKTTHRIAYVGLIAAVTMLSGVFIQPLVSKLGDGFVPPAVLGLGLAFVGMLVAWHIAHSVGLGWMFVAAVFLGCSYGTMMVSGLREVERIAPPGDLGALISVFYSLTYVGFFAPFVLSILGPAFGYSNIFLFGAAVIVVSVFPVTYVIKSHSPR